MILVVVILVVAVVNIVAVGVVVTIVITAVVADVDVAAIVFAGYGAGSLFGDGSCLFLFQVLNLLDCGTAASRHGHPQLCACSACRVHDSSGPVRHNSCSDAGTNACSNTGTDSSTNACPDACPNACANTRPNQPVRHNRCTYARSITSTYAGMC